MKLKDSDRKKLVSIMDMLYAHYSQMDYPLHDIRGARDAETWTIKTETAARTALRNGKIFMFDCSQFVTQICRWAGLLDPNGLAYRYPGYTGTLLHHLPHYDNPADALPGGLVVYGPGTGEHVSMVKIPGTDPVLFSHGRKGTIDIVRLSEQKRRHRAPVTFLSINNLRP